MSVAAKVVEGCGGYRKFRDLIADWLPLPCEQDENPIKRNCSELKYAFMENGRELSNVTTLL